MSKVVVDSLKPLLAQMDPALARLSIEELSVALGYTTGEKPAEVPVPARWEDPLIEQIIPHGASVLDLGCGDGELLAKLRKSKGVRGQGIELDTAAAFGCIARGVQVFQIDLDSGLHGFEDNSFDYVVLEETLQTLHKPIDLLQEMLRVGRRGIVSFPNFGFWKVRLDLLLRGKMPVTEQLPYRWYDTPNIHLMTLQDFMDWVQQHKVKIAEAHVFADGKIRPMQEGDNLYAEHCLLVVER